jgi:hypothetical protein
MLHMNKMKAILAKIRTINDSYSGLAKAREEYLRRIKRNEKSARPLIVRALILQMQREGDLK